MENKDLREMKEMSNLFKDPKFARQAWRAVGNAVLSQPCRKIVGNVDKDGNSTLGGDIELYSYSKLKEDISKLGKEDREPTELEMILQCQIVKARYDTAAATFIRDTLGAKPVDETKLDAQVNNPYESMTDEELEMLAKYREQKSLELNAVNKIPLEEVKEIDT